MSEDKPQKFAVFAEVEDYDRPLILTGLEFGRLMDDVIVPYESDKPFFVEGAPVKKDPKVKKLKIIRQKEGFEQEFYEFHWTLRHGNIKEQKLYGDQYYIRIEALLRFFGEDVTSQVIKAFDQKIRPCLKDYLPKRQKLIEAALSVFIQSLKLLGST